MFLNIFYAIDTNGNEKITIKELEQYAIDEDLDESLVKVSNICVLVQTKRMVNFKKRSNIAFPSRVINH